MKGVRSIGIPFHFWAENIVTSVTFSQKPPKSVGVTPFDGIYCECINLQKSSPNVFSILNVCLTKVLFQYGS